MVKYMRAEFYKVLHRKYTYGFLVVILLLEAMLVAGWAYTNANGNDVNFSSGASILCLMLGVGLYCTVLTGDMVFSDQYKFNTLKNEVSYGVPRSRIYLGKLAVECLVALVLCAVVIAFYLGMCWVFLPHDPATDGQILQEVGYCLLVSLPLWLGAQALVNLVFFLIKSSTVGSFVVVGIFMGVPPILKLLGMLVHPIFTTIYSGLLTTPFEQTASALNDWAFFGRACAIGAGWFVACTLIGLVLFRNKEIN